MNDNELLIEEIEKNGIGSGGKNALLRYLKRESIHRSAAIKAKCFECCGYYGDGRVNCNIPTCPLYPFIHLNIVFVLQVYHHDTFCRLCQFF
jgi:hypothetical protein